MQLAMLVFCKLDICPHIKVSCSRNLASVTPDASEDVLTCVLLYCGIFMFSVPLKIHVQSDGLHRVQRNKIVL